MVAHIGEVDQRRLYFSEAAPSMFAETTPTSRYVPAAVKRVVYERDGGQCTFVDKSGRRCSAREGLEFHHAWPYGRGSDHSPDIVCLMCRSHNLYLAELEYGEATMARYRKSRKRVGSVVVCDSVQAEESPQASVAGSADPPPG